MKRLAIVTGARGAIGQQVAHRLIATGWEVAGLGHGAKPDGLDVPGWINGEVDSSNLDALCGVRIPSAIIHLAGGSAVGPSLAAPAEDFARTTDTAVHLLEWVRLRAPDTAVVLASSAAVYGADHERAIAETSPRAPSSPYGYHKAMMEMAGESWARNFGIRISIIRLFSVYGGRLRKQLVWEVCSRLAKGERDFLFGGTGAETRDWIDIDDAARMLIDATGVASAEPAVLNGCTGTPMSIARTVELLFEGAGVDATAHFTGERRAGDPTHLVGDAALSAQMGFRAMITPEEGLRRAAQSIVGPIGAR